MRPVAARNLALGVASVLSGAAALVYQVLWARLLGLGLGNTVEGAATVLAVFMAGLGLGSGLASRALRSRGVARWSYASLEAAIALTALAVPPLVAALSARLGATYDAQAATTLALARAAIAGVALIAPSTLMGATLPVLGALTGVSGEREAGVAGWLYAANTVGALLGCLSTPFVLLPEFGVSRSLLIAAASTSLPRRS